PLLPVHARAVVALLRCGREEHRRSDPARAHPARVPRDRSAGRRHGGQGMTMKVLVTGAGGFLGRRIVDSLLRQGVDHVRVHVRQKPPAGMIEDLRARYPEATIEVAQANLLSRGALEPLVEGVDCVVHAAAGMKGAAADMFANTVLTSRNLLEAACAQ